MKKDYETEAATLTAEVKKSVWEIVRETIKKAPLTPEESQSLKDAQLAVPNVEMAGADIERIYRQVNDFATTAGRMRALAVSM